MYHNGSGVQIKNYGLIDTNSSGNNNNNHNNNSKSRNSSQNGFNPTERKTSTSHESGYSSDYASGTSPNSSSRASPRGSIEEEGETSEDSHSSTSDLGKKDNNVNNLSPPKKPIRLSKLKKDIEDNIKAEEEVPYRKTVKDYKMVRLAKNGEELGIIIAKKKLKEIQTTGFHIVHIEPEGLIDR